MFKHDQRGLRLYTYVRKAYKHTWESRNIMRRNMWSEENSGETDAMIIFHFLSHVICVYMCTSVWSVYGHSVWSQDGLACCSSSAFIFIFGHLCYPWTTLTALFLFILLLRQCLLLACKLEGHMTLPSQCWDYKHAPPCLAFFFSLFLPPCVLGIKCIPWCLQGR